MPNWLSIWNPLAIDFLRFFLKYFDKNHFYLWWQLRFPLILLFPQPKWFIQMTLLFVLVNTNIIAPNSLLHFFHQIAQLISGDILADSYTLPLDDSKLQFKQIFQFLRWEKLEITSDNRDYLTEVGELLGNQEIIIRVRDYIPQNVNALTVFQSALNKMEQHIRPDQELEYIAAHLTDFSHFDFCDFRVEDLYSIFFSNNLCTDDESIVFQIIMEIIRNRHPQARMLLYSIAYENLTVAEMIEFADEITRSELTGPIFLGLWKRLINHVSHRRHPIYQIYDNQEFAFVEGYSFDGFFNAMNQIWKTNPQEEGIVKIVISDGTPSAKIIARN